MQARTTRQRGFTLIELVVVIVILGILAAFAIPRFANIARDARMSALNGMAGTLRSTAALVHGMALARNVVDATAASNTIALEGTGIQVKFGYPAAQDDGIQRAVLNLDPATYTVVDNGTSLTIDVVGATGANCDVTYTEPAANGQPATVTVNASATDATTGC